ncbi:MULTISPECIES: 50S ribosomal protein L29 [Nitrosomonas]|uniref:Large ribosomal subunit protein uL29 n=1 Tax=Nitrosomonas oligotropha TaxID=42354 RepID=A0A1H8NCL8_9PROT|nr:50S ribosomal protein L29 [Nitrosomonas oligotropha]MBX9636756.1 50S ribosomal protein L29 [Nitrosomonas sp.]PTQ76507.1 LSU ribosomal protein L29P [Nitrosomonas oligotropha]SDW94646.1 LSU ribosomal protein L29P [Nitrosomonas oligotropha]SEO27340.1 LSU ribosomal protein L29P [Nitrosomonas oligotropha]
MKVSELKEKSISELNKELISLLRVQFSLRMQLATQQLSDTSRMKIIRKDIARVKTIMTQKAS